MYPIIKRFFDLLFSAVLVAFLLPIGLIICAFLLLAHGPNGIIFTQNRIGLRCKEFRLYKFKSMNNERDEQGNLKKDSDRLTPIGSFLRKTSLDELPQLFNVIKGDMSIIGPRPLLPRYLKLYTEEQNRRHEIRPGISGWAQVNGRNNISWKEKFELDVYYVDHLSFLLDLKVIFLTVEKVIRRKDITSEDPSTFQPFNGSN